MHIPPQIRTDLRFLLRMILRLMIRPWGHSFQVAGAGENTKYVVAEITQQLYILLPFSNYI